MFKTTRHDSFQLISIIFAFHGESFTGPCLSIGEYSAIVAFQDTFYYRKCSILVHIFLFAVAIEHLIKGECFMVIIVLRILNNDFSFGLIQLNNTLSVSLYFRLTKWTTPDDHSYTFPFIAHPSNL